MTGSRGSYIDSIRVSRLLIASPRFGLGALFFAPNSLFMVGDVHSYGAVGR